ncbi:MAG: MT-A70 family methyltransferase [Veillonellales bacterium]
MRIYSTIYADPPWMERGGGKIKRGADRHYKLMTTKDIMALPIISNIAADNCHLYLWTTNNFLPDALKVMAAWGFTYKTMITWVKSEYYGEGTFKLQNAGLGQYYRGLTEHCLFGIKGCLPYKIDPMTLKRQQGKTAFIAPRTHHSEKPPEMRQMIEKVSYEPRIELFARERFTGWDVWGNEISSNINFSCP